jgi:protein phosphatase
MLRAFGVSDAGRVRKTNEDRFVSDVDLRLFAVADGMGGHSAGEVAANIAIETVTEFVRRSVADPDLTWPHGLDADLTIDGNRLRTAVMLANRTVLRSSITNEEYHGMGATVVGVLVCDSQMTIAHVGDSRIYMLADGRLEQLTRDDSWVETLLAQDPTLAAADLASHPMRNVLTNVLGAREDVEVHMGSRPLTGGEVVLLCSDGIHGVLTSDALRDILLATPDVERAAHAVVTAAMDSGSRDNVTAIVVRYEP